MALGNIDEDAGAFKFNWIGFEINANRCALSYTCGVIKAAIVFWAFNDVVHHQAIGQMDFFVGAEAISCVELIIGRTENREGAA